MRSPRSVGRYADTASRQVITGGDVANRRRRRTASGTTTASGR